MHYSLFLISPHGYMTANIEYKFLFLSKTSSKPNQSDDRINYSFTPQMWSDRLSITEDSQILFEVMNTAMV